jgi:hypothetical protein
MWGDGESGPADSGASEPRESPGKKPVPPQLLANQWKPGQSGNPAGRPKGMPSLFATMRRLLAQGMDDEGVSEHTKHIVEALIAKAREGDPGAQKILWERLEGAVPKEHKHSGNVGIKVLDLRETDSP